MYLIQMLLGGNIIWTEVALVGFFPTGQFFGNIIMYLVIAVIVSVHIANVKKRVCYNPVQTYLSPSFVYLAQKGDWDYHTIDTKATENEWVDVGTESKKERRTRTEDDEFEANPSSPAPIDEFMDDIDDDDNNSETESEPPSSSDDEQIAEEIIMNSSEKYSKILKRALQVPINYYHDILDYNTKVGSDFYVALLIVGMLSAR